MNPQETKLIERAVRKLTKREIRDVAKHHMPHAHGPDEDTDNPPLGSAKGIQVDTPANENRGFAAREAARRATPCSKGR